VPVLVTVLDGSLECAAQAPRRLAWAVSSSCRYWRSVLRDCPCLPHHSLSETGVPDPAVDQGSLVL